MSAADAPILDGLNPEQRRAAEAVRGPVCILAGAGSGKTTTITRRIAHQVASAAFRPSEILAVTFTDKAAGVMKSRLATLGVSGVAARTFHSAALAQLHYFAPGRVGRILPSKALLLRQIANGLPAPYKFRPAGDLATEIEWAKAQRIGAQEYPSELGEHEPPIPADLMSSVYREYELRKSDRNELDFEDLLELAVRLFESSSEARGTFRERYRAFTVDEYQDVNLLQQALLELWLGDREDLCVVGDDYQSIYGFTGASPRWLLGVADRFPSATVVRLESNYRSSPEVLELANRLVPRLEGADKVLRATQASGPAPVARPFATEEAEDAWIAVEVERLHNAGIPYEEIAVLGRTNARLADFEPVFHDAGIPFQGSSLLARDAARRMLKLLDRDGSTSVAARVRVLADDAGLLLSPPDKLGEREQTRQSDLSRLVRLASEFDDGERTCADFAAELRLRFDAGGAAARGLHLLTYHRAKGLEFDAVFLPRMEEKELPSKLARTPEEQAEERRLLYVGLTRARKALAITWSKRPSPFLAELGIGGQAAPVAAPARRSRDDSAAAEVLRAWRRERASADGVPAYVVFPDRTLDELLARRPTTPGELAGINGLGVKRLERFGRELFAAVKEALAASSEPPPTDDPVPSVTEPGLYDALAAWRRERSKSDEVPAFHVFPNRVLEAIADARPGSREELAEVWGVGPTKVDRYGDEVLRVVAAA
ncbi:MAG TPA: ATP-dependent DNA helicase UvrD2 [Gaiellaceae bacterium]|nr:ATP-dependent DNA helicase UvrD2 [Gaiellaceae bacterium]